ERINSLKKSPQPARFCVGFRLKMLMYSRVHCAFSPKTALTRTRLRPFLKAVGIETMPREKQSVALLL
ncbi:MAG: hypothetical protein AAFX10_16170, partial [Pseudomonadota bacterium]